MARLMSISSDFLFTFATVANTRGHDYKLYKPYCCGNLRRKFFNYRVINVWNSHQLLISVVTYRSVQIPQKTSKDVESRRRTPKDAVFQVIKLYMSTKTPPCVFVVF